MSDQDSSIAEFVTGLVEDVSPKQLVGAGRRIFSATSQAKLDKAIQGFEDDDDLRALVAEAIRAETAEFARAESLDQVLDVVVRVLLEVQRQGDPGPARTDSVPPWLVLEGNGVAASGARVVRTFNLADAASLTSTVELSMSVRNVGGRAAEHVVVELHLPFTSSDVSVWYGQERHDSPPHELLDPNRPVFIDSPVADGGRTVLRQRVRLVAPGTSESLVRVGLTFRSRERSSSSSFGTIRYSIRAFDGPHTAGEIEVQVGFERGVGVPLRWEATSTWVRNAHPEGDELRVFVGDEVVRVPEGDVVELKAAELDSPENRVLEDWRSHGWLRREKPPAWARSGPRTYLYLNPKVPRLLVRRVGATARVLTWKACVDLSADDLAMPENRTLRRYVLDKLVVPVEEGDPWEGEAARFAPPVDLGLQATQPVNEDLSPMSGAEYRAKLVEKGCRPRRLSSDDLVARSATVLSVLEHIADPNGISAGTWEELEGWSEHALAPEEARRVVALLVEKGEVIEERLDSDGMFAVRVLCGELLGQAGPTEDADEMWEHAMLHQRLSDAIDDSFEQRRDLELGLTQGRRQSPPEDEEILGLVRSWVDRLQPWFGAVERLLKEHLPKALGADGEPGDARELDYVARKVGRMHAEFIALGHEWLAIGASGKWGRVVEHQVRVALSLADDIERFRDDLGRAVQVGRQHDGREPLELFVTLELRGHGIAEVSDLVEETLGRSV